MFRNPVHLYIGITDSDWFSFLALQQPDEVNFWQPSGNRVFRVLEPGQPFLFKLHSPDNYIVGGGFYSHSTILPVSFAWEAFGAQNGAATLDEMRRRVEHYRRSTATIGEDYKVGCILLQQPFFFPREQWIPVPNWSKNIVQGKSMGGADSAALWAQVEARLNRPMELDETATESPKYGTPTVVLPRLGQGAFRVVVADNYSRQCALTSSHILHILQAAHIRPFSRGGTHSPANGLLLRQDVHTLFDRGYLTVTTDYRVEISKKIKEEFNNGAEYYAMHGRDIHIPEETQFRPAKELLTWHNDNVFKG